MVCCKGDGERTAEGREEECRPDEGELKHPTHPELHVYNPWETRQIGSRMQLLHHVAGNDLRSSVGSIDEREACSKEECEEMAGVVVTNAVVDPDTMVVHL